MPTPDRTSVAEIVGAAQGILEERGAAGVTMQAVAERVGVRAPSLYKRVRDRDALVDLVAEATADDLTNRLLAAQRSLPEYARVVRVFAHEKPQGFRLMFATTGATDATRRSADPVLSAARDLVGEEHALSAARMFTAWVTGFMNMELSGAFRMGGDVDEAFEFALATMQAGLLDQASRPGQVFPAQGE